VVVKCIARKALELGPSDSVIRNMLSGICGAPRIQDHGEQTGLRDDKGCRLYFQDTYFLMFLIKVMLER